MTSKRLSVCTIIAQQGRVVSTRLPPISWTQKRVTPYGVPLQIQVGGLSSAQSTDSKQRSYLKK
tara:strand:+ start:50011 stop:50202 length:192 start_codon:yes stop_codon:yes gene_type:complete